VERGLELVRDPISVDAFCGRHSARKEAVFSALLDAIRYYLRELEDSRQALPLAVGTTEAVTAQRDELNRLNDIYVRRVGRLEAENSFLQRVIRAMEDAGDSGCSTWQWLRSPGTILLRQNAMLRRCPGMTAAEQGDARLQYDASR
jgi:hypothetical protein